jgi:3-ketosteroid 9alpha-monooxygenase subunit A
MHFRFSHGASVHPKLLDFDASGAHWRSCIGFPSPRNGEMALRVYNLNAGIGLSFAVFDSIKARYRLILTATPVDDDRSDLRVSYFLPRKSSSPDHLSADQLAFARHTVELYEQDARIWRRQVFVQKPVYARQDVAGYSALRKWCEQFYEAPEGPSPTRAVVE